MNNYKISKQMPCWFLRAPYIRYGYRYHKDMTVQMCNSSLLQWHNQTMNVFTHLLPAFYFLCELKDVLLGQGLYADFKNKSSVVTLVVAAVSIIFCMLSSSAFHLYMPLGRKYYSRLLRVDLLGIGIMIFGLTLSVAYVGLHNYERVKHITLTLIMALMVSNIVIQLTPCYGKDSFHFKRVIMFVAMIVLCLALIAFLRLKIASTQEIDRLYQPIYQAMMSLAIGFFFYVSHAPERFLTRCFGKKKSSRWIREWIQLLCPSHALWHIGVFGNGYGLFWAVYYFNRHVEAAQHTAGLV